MEDHSESARDWLGAGQAAPVRAGARYVYVSRWSADEIALPAGGMNSATISRSSTESRTLVSTAAASAELHGRFPMCQRQALTFAKPSSTVAPMPESIFISYRRTDSQHAVFAIADRLRSTFGPERVFLDRSVIKPGDEWPKSLRRGVKRAAVVLPVIGENWLTTADEWGRRRIDDENDWVRREIGAALAANRRRNAIIPVLLENAKWPRAEAFDPSLRRLARLEPLSLTADEWEAGLEALIVRVAKTTGLARLAGSDGRHSNGAPARPRRVQKRQQPLKDADVRAALEPLAQWHLQWAPHSWGAGGLAQEIAKSFDFTSFAQAVAFMSAASGAIDAWKPPHHPRWENQWKVVNVFFTTWDVDCRVTKLDIEAAKKFDALVDDWRASPHSPAGPSDHGDRRQAVEGAGQEYVHVAGDDYSPARPGRSPGNQTGAATTAFLRRSALRNEPSTPVEKLHLHFCADRERPEQRLPPLIRLIRRRDLATNPLKRPLDLCWSGRQSLDVSQIVRKPPARHLVATRHQPVRLVLGEGVEIGSQFRERLLNLLAHARRRERVTL